MSGPASKTVLVITGPTASGKTGLAIEVARQLRTSIISADSRQCYQGMAIGTAQPTAEELAAVKHYFINQFPVTQPVSAADFERLALAWLEEIFTSTDTALVCGGTGLYIRALCDGLDEMPPVEERIVAQIDATFKSKGITWLQETLRLEDPAFVGNPEWTNPARLQRALSFVRSTGRSILEFRSGEKKRRSFRIVKVALDMPREQLYTRINARVDAMMAAGLLEEVKALWPFKDLKPLQTVGYAELFEYLEGRRTLEEAVDKIKQHTRNYAKRQLTWLKREDNITWLEEPTAEGIMDRLRIHHQ